MGLLSGGLWKWDAMLGIILGQTHTFSPGTSLPKPTPGRNIGNPRCLGPYTLPIASYLHSGI